MKMICQYFVSTLGSNFLSSDTTVDIIEGNFPCPIRVKAPLRMLLKWVTFPKHDELCYVIAWRNDSRYLFNFWEKLIVFNFSYQPRKKRDKMFVKMFTHRVIAGVSTRPGPNI